MLIAILVAMCGVAVAATFVKREELNREMPDKWFVEKCAIMLGRGIYNSIGIFFVAGFNVCVRAGGWIVRTFVVMGEEISAAVDNIAWILNSALLRKIRGWITRAMNWIWGWIEPPLRFVFKIVFNSVFPLILIAVGYIVLKWAIGLLLK